MRVQCRKNSRRWVICLETIIECLHNESVAVLLTIRCNGQHQSLLVPFANVNDFARSKPWLQTSLTSSEILYKLHTTDRLASDLHFVSNVQRIPSVHLRGIASIFETNRDTRAESSHTWYNWDCRVYLIKNWSKIRSIVDTRYTSAVHINVERILSPRYVITDNREIFINLSFLSIYSSPLVIFINL